MALAYRKKNAFDEASALLEHAVELARRGGMVRPFVELAPSTTDLLERLSKAKRGDNFINKLLVAVRDDEHGGARRSADGYSDQRPPLAEQPLIEPLTRRELEILDLLDQRLYNKEIAERLFVSMETVKSHLTNIYQKLQVKTRREAVHEARSLGILKQDASDA
jgi:LuxR family maltose regulon positive regulatory protein